jgi:hypothetical protein
MRPSRRSSSRNATTWSAIRSLHSSGGSNSATPSGSSVSMTPTILAGSTVAYRHADPRRGVVDRDERPLRRQRQRANVVHLSQAGRMPSVQLDDHSIGMLQERRRRSDGRTQVDAAVAGHFDRFDHCHVEVAEKPALHHLRQVRKVHIDEFDLLPIDSLPQGRAALIRRRQDMAFASANASSSAGRCLRRSGRECETARPIMKRLGPRGERPRRRLRRPRGREPEKPTSAPSGIISAASQAESLRNPLLAAIEPPCQRRKRMPPAALDAGAPPFEA